MLRRLALVLPVLVLAACNLPRGTAEPTFDPNLVATMVEETLQGFPTPTNRVKPATATFDNSTPTVKPSPTAVVSKVTGKVCFPKTGRSDLRAFFQEVTKGTVSELAISAASNDYEVTLDPGNYIAYVWLPDFSFGGMYSTSTTPSPFAVFPGETTNGIDLCDWSHGPFDVPYPPGTEPQQTTGSITGSVSYPYGDIPVLTLVAFSKSTPYWYWVGTAAGQRYFTMVNLPPGKYQVVAYDGSGRAGGSDVVTVTAGDSAQADVTDWNGSFPANPVK
jgi:Polysaccharide lyase family 4, domain II